MAVARPDLDVWVITGDGDGLSIGGNHLIHALRRNVNLTILMFNNRIYGLTKGQYSPTSEFGKVTKSTPLGSIDPPFNPLAVALGAEASFVARTHDLDRKHMIETFRAAHAHRGASFVEIFQNCNVFNDGAFDEVTGKEKRPENMIDLHHGQPIRFGADGSRGVVMGSDGQLRLVEVADVGEDALLVHDAYRADPSLAFALARLSSDDHSPTPFGIFRSVDRPDYGTSVGQPTRCCVGGEGARRPRRPVAVERYVDGARRELSVAARLIDMSVAVDAAMVEAFRRGDDEAVRQMYRAYSRLVLSGRVPRARRSRSGRRSDAADVPAGVAKRRRRSRSIVTRHRGW